MNKNKYEVVNDTSVGTFQKRQHRRGLKEEVLGYLTEDTSRDISSKKISSMFKCNDYTSLDILKNLEKRKLIKLVGIKQGSHNYYRVYKSVESSTPSIKITSNKSLYCPLKTYLLRRGIKNIKTKEASFVIKYLNKNKIRMVALSIGKGRYCEAYPIKALNEAVDALNNKSLKKDTIKRINKNTTLNQKNSNAIKNINLNKTCPCKNSKSIFKFKIFGKEISLNIK